MQLAACVSHLDPLRRLTKPVLLNEALLRRGCLASYLTISPWLWRDTQRRLVGHLLHLYLDLELCVAVREAAALAWDGVTRAV